MSTARLSMVEVAVLVTADITDPTEAATWVATIWAESGGDPVAYNLNDHDPTSRSYLSTDNGLLQINSYWHGANLPVHEANRPELAWAYAKQIGNVGNGSDWSPWNAYKNGAYLRYMDDAVAAVAELLEPKGTDVTFWHEREDWVTAAEPVSGPTFPGWALMSDGIVVHYPGHDNPPKTPEAVPQAIRNSHHYYLTERKYSYGYNHIIDPWGEIWEVRGFEFRNAANVGSKVTRNVNHTTVSVQLITPLSGQYTEAQRVALSDYVLECDRLAGRTLQVNGHSHWEDTSCPGDPIRGLIKSGVRITTPAPTPTPAPEPTPTPEPTPEPKDDMPTILIEPKSRRGLFQPSGAPVSIQLFKLYEAIHGPAVRVTNTDAIPAAAKTASLIILSQDHPYWDAHLTSQLGTDGQRLYDELGPR